MYVNQRRGKCGMTRTMMEMGMDNGEWGTNDRGNNEMVEDLRDGVDASGRNYGWHDGDGFENRNCGSEKLCGTRCSGVIILRRVKGPNREMDGTGPTGTKHGGGME